MNCLKSIRYVFFDLDGVLADSEPIKAAAHMITAKTLHNFDLTIDDYIKVMGHSQLDVVTHFIGKSAESKELISEYNQFFLNTYMQLLLERLRPIPAAIPLLNCLKNMGIRNALVSSSPRNLVKLICDHVGLTPHITFKICADDIERHKPHPDPYLAALNQAKITIAEALAVEDTDAGITAATSAGLLVVAVRHQLNCNHTLSSAHIKVNGLRSLLDLWCPQSINLIS